MFRSLVCAIGTFGFLISAITCSPTSVSSSSIVIKKINSATNLPSSPLPPVTSSSSPSPTVDEVPVDSSFNSLGADSSIVNRPSINESPTNLKPSESQGDYPVIRAIYVPNYVGKPRGPGHFVSTPSPSLTSSFSSAFSPSKLLPSLFSSPSTSSHILPSASVHSLAAFRPIGKLLDLFNRNDNSHDDSLAGRDNFQPKVHPYLRRQPSTEKIHPEYHGNSLNSPFFYSNDLHPDLTKSGSISRSPWFANTLRGPSLPAQKSTLRSIFEKLFG